MIHATDKQKTLIRFHGRNVHGWNKPAEGNWRAVRVRRISMTIDTKLPFDQEYISSFSKEANEPSWLLDLRLQALAKAEDLALPKPDKTNISKWNFTAFDKHTSQASTISSVDELPEVVKALIDTKAVKNLYVQRDQTAAYSTLTEELKSQGVIFTDIQTAAKEEQHARMERKTA